MSKTSRLPRALAVSALAFAALGMTGDAHAERMGSSVGAARLGNERTCLRYDFGRVVNTCNFPVLYTITPRALTGSRTFKATGHGGVSCRAIRVDGFGFNTAQTAARPVAGTTTLGTLSIGSGDAVIFECVFPAVTAPSAWLGTIVF
jgi:hypothetical protein